MAEPTGPRSIPIPAGNTVRGTGAISGKETKFQKLEALGQAFQDLLSQSPNLIVQRFRLLSRKPGHNQHFNLLTRKTGPLGERNGAPCPIHEAHLAYRAPPKPFGEMAVVRWRGKFVEQNDQLTS